MTHRELAVLDAVNIATTRYRRPGRSFEATAAQITEVLNTDERIQDEYPISLTTREVAATLVLLRKKWTRHYPLVDKIDSRRWRLTSAGCDALGA